MLTLETKADLDRLVSEGVPESLTLDYKRAEALGKSSKERNELSKDVSAFANSAGGQIVYGIVEENNSPTMVQGADSIDPKQFSREWIEQTIDSNVHPRIEGVRIHSASDNFLFMFDPTYPPSSFALHALALLRSPRAPSEAFANRTPAVSS
jgi:predicted HTH transcriptional regulator